ncbi:MAG: Glycosyl transferase group 1 [Parcubacteria group bacterium GW2011_GWA2_43_13]|nr:MAG: Glycosyl transferase group 1 [Parcubacteria group bacterium GW2011_GWA2_43_13]
MVGMHANIIIPSMHIGIDARLYGTYGRGIGQYLKHLIAELERLDAENEYTVFVSKQGWREYQPTNPHFHKKMVDIRLYTLKEQLLLPWIIFRKHIDLMHFPHFTVPLFTKQPFVMTIHDMIIHKFPTEYATHHSHAMYRLKLWGYRLTLARAIKRARHIIAVSNHTRDDILSYYPHAQKKCSVIHEGVAQVNPVAQEVQHAYLNRLHLVSHHYLFYIGAAYPHKNLSAMIQGYMMACDTDPTIATYPFIIAGRQDVFHSQLEQLVCTTYPDIHSRIQWIGEITDEERSILYANATFFMYITCYEGFGLPVLEAMSHGTPVLISDRGSLQEIAEDAAVRVSPDHPKDIAHTIVRCLSHPDVLSEYARRGIHRATQFSWRTTGQQTIECYQQIFNSKQ